MIIGTKKIHKQIEIKDKVKQTIKLNLINFLKDPGKISIKDSIKEQSADKKAMTTNNRGIHNDPIHDQENNMDIPIIQENINLPIIEHKATVPNIEAIEVKEVIDIEFITVHRCLRAQSKDNIFVNVV